MVPADSGNLMAAEQGALDQPRGTRVPVTALFENLEDGALVSEFVAWFPGVTTDQARAVLKHAARSAWARA